MSALSRVLKHVGLEQGALEAYKEEYFKINTSPGSGGGSVKGSALDHHERKPLERATSEVVRKDGWPDMAWPDPSKRQHQLQLFSIFLNE